MKKTNIFKNPYLIFIPYLIIFIIYALMVPTNGTDGDQPRYLMYAHNLLNGFYSPPVPNIHLTNGPGYPMVLMPFLLLKLPLISITISNAFFYYFSIIFLFKALKEIVSNNIAITVSFVWASYFIAYRNIPYIATETFTYLLVSVLIYSVLKSFKSQKPNSINKYVILAGFIFGYIALTKMIFGYILLFMLVGFGLLWILHKNKLNYRKGLVITLIAFLSTMPYLIYTYHLTNRIFYWGTGSDNLYWMTSPFDEEYGDWTANLTQNSPMMANYNIYHADSVLRTHHQADFEEIFKYTGIERDDAFKKLAIRNIKTHPLKYAKNVFYNIGRLVFHYPFSQAIQQPKILGALLVNGILLTLILFSLIPTIINWRKIPITIQFLLIITLLYLGASSLVCALIRMFTIAVPILLLWIAYIVQHTVKIKLKFKEDPDSKY